jgi:hypothetical protein
MQTGDLIHLDEIRVDFGEGASSNALTTGPGYNMGDDSFQRAVQRARRAYSFVDWTSIPPRERTEAIYRELRRIDADRAARLAEPKQPVQPQLVRRPA